MTAKRRDKRPICRCHVWGFPHRLSVTLCEPDDEFMARLYLSHRDLWDKMVDRMDPDYCGGDDPGDRGYIARKDAMERA